jgi:hypothetical protein
VEAQYGRLRIQDFAGGAGNALGALLRVGFAAYRALHSAEGLCADRGREWLAACHGREGSRSPIIELTMV